jgi:hypothetical protein
MYYIGKYTQVRGEEMFPLDISIRNRPRKRISLESDTVQAGRNLPAFLRNALLLA